MKFAGHARFWNAAGDAFQEDSLRQAARIERVKRPMAFAGQPCSADKLAQPLGNGYSRSGPNTTNMTRFCDHTTLTTTTPKINYFHWKYKFKACEIGVLNRI